MSKEKIIEFLRSYPNKYPSVMVYRELINLACRKFNIRMDEAEKNTVYMTGENGLNYLN